jgi:hypothetical protein
MSENWVHYHDGVDLVFSWINKAPKHDAKLAEIDQIQLIYVTFIYEIFKTGKPLQPFELLSVWDGNAR